jgi:glucan-binding YG repeat protein
MYKKFLKSLLVAMMVVVSMSTTSFASTQKAGWVQNLTGNYSYYDTGSNTPSYGFKQILGKWYYFDTTGAMQTGWLKKTYGFDTQWFYFNPDGTMHTDWLSFDGHYYFFGDDGVMKTGWIDTYDSWYFASVNGVIQKGVFQIDGAIYKLDPQMIKGVSLINGQKYTFGQNGAAYGNLPTPEKAFTHYGVDVNVTTQVQNEDFPSDVQHVATSPTDDKLKLYSPSAVTSSTSRPKVAPAGYIPTSTQPAYDRDGGNTNSNNTVNSNNTKNSNNHTTVINNYYNTNSNNDDEE